MKIRIFVVAYFKFHDKGPDYGFKRMDLQTLYTDLQTAREKSKEYFCDEAGWYEGILIEEKEEGNPFSFKGQRVFYTQKADNSFEEIPEPEVLKGSVNLI